MATVQSYTKAGVDNLFGSRSNMTLVHGGGGTPDIAAYPDAKTGDVIDRDLDGARWRVVGGNLNPMQGRVVSVAGKTGLVTLSPSDVGAAPSSHTHTKAQITDLNASATATANSIAQRDSSGRLVVGTPSTATHATTKAYVDAAVSTGISGLSVSATATPNSVAQRDANSRLVVADPLTDTHAATKKYVDASIVSGTTWDKTSGKPTTFPPSSHTHTVAQITDLTLATPATANTTPLRNAAGTFEVTNPTIATHVANKTYVDSAITAGTTWANTSGKPTTFTPSAHTHTIAQITDLTVVEAATAGTVPKRGTGGVIIVGTPTATTHATTKAYVDSAVTGAKAWSSLTGVPSSFTPSAHTHTTAQITDLTLAIPATPSTTPLRGTDGTIITADPTLDTHAATKKYVDNAAANGVTWSTLTGKPSTFSPSSHTHTVADITDLRLATTATATTVVQRESGGSITVGTPTVTTHATTKAYVDSAVTGAKAWSNLTGVPSTFAPSAHTHTMSDITGLSAEFANHTHKSAAITDTVANISGSSTDFGRILALDSAGRISASAPQSITHVANKQYVDDAVSSGTTWANTSGKPTSFPPTSHTHTVAQITDLTLSTAATANTVAQRDTSGRVTVATPASSGHATTKTYVDNAITDAKKWTSLTGVPTTFTPSAHTHTSSDISNTTSLIPGSSTYSGRVLALDSNGRLMSNDPVSGKHVSNKDYVDASVSALTPWVGTKTQYDAITTPDPNRLYIIRN